MKKIYKYFVNLSAGNILELNTLKVILLALNKIDLRLFTFIFIRFFLNFYFLFNANANI